MTGWHLAQINIGRLRHELDHPSMAEFVAGLEPVNALADKSPGFVWRLQSEAGDSTAIRVFDDPLMLINMSLWRSLEDLRRFAYKTGHARFLAQRRNWFEPMAGPNLALWWVEAGTLPTVEDGKAALDRLAAEGPTPQAFTFKQPFPPPGAGLVERSAERARDTTSI